MWKIRKKNSIKFFFGGMNNCVLSGIGTYDWLID